MLIMEVGSAAHTWYESPVWAFIGVAAAIVVVPTALYQLWQAWRERRPRRLVYGVLSSAPLLTGPSVARRRVSVTLDGAPLNRPQVVTIRLAHRGRRDIPIAAFDGALPLHLTLDTPILQILATDPGPGPDHTDPIPAVLTPDATTLAVGPVTIRAGQQTTWTLLVDTPHRDGITTHPAPAALSLTHQNPPLDTPTTRQDTLQDTPLAPWRLAAVMAVMTVPAAVVAAIAREPAEVMTAVTTVMAVAVAVPMRARRRQGRRGRQGQLR